jgi:hypothetical protein
MSGKSTLNRRIELLMSSPPVQFCEPSAAISSRSAIAVFKALDSELILQTSGLATYVFINSSRSQMPAIELFVNLLVLGMHKGEHRKSPRT